jgi:hypothetical protein
MADSGWFGPFAAETRRTTAWRGAMSCLVGEARGALALRLAKHPGHAGEALTFLSDLAPAEQAALIDSNERGVLPQVAPYQRFCHETARRLDARLREIASGRCSQAGTTRSRLSVMVDVASEGAATILQQWPERFDLLQALPMDGLPGPLRRQVWEMRLRQHLGAVAETDKLRSTDSDALVWNTCRDVVAVLGLPSLSYRVMPMKDVICHLRAVHHGPAWTPLYLVLAPLLEVALGDGGSSRASADEAVGDRERPHGVRGTLPPWCMDRSSPNGAEDGRGRTRRRLKPSLSSLRGTRAAAGRTRQPQSGVGWCLPCRIACINWMRRITRPSVRCSTMQLRKRSSKEVGGSRGGMTQTRATTGVRRDWMPRPCSVQ